MSEGLWEGVVCDWAVGGGRGSSCAPDHYPPRLLAIRLRCTLILRLEHLARKAHGSCANRHRCRLLHQYCRDVGPYRQLLQDRLGGVVEV